MTDIEDSVAIAHLEEAVKGLTKSFDRHTLNEVESLVEIKEGMRANSKDIQTIKEGLAEVQGARAALKFMFRGLVLIAGTTATWFGLDIWSNK
jgi:hypothetical protein